MCQIHTAHLELNDFDNSIIKFAHEKKRGSDIQHTHQYRNILPGFEATEGASSISWLAPQDNTAAGIGYGAYLAQMDEIKHSAKALWYFLFVVPSSPFFVLCD